ncbi:hypothetical protein SAMN05421812_101463 [Asanoa hainanensis]|uniref:Uncharacterized protein n=1 Tax=Asanoa hainanensis TaxID=560556 RepID=A0A239GL80_9ACTN|nr:hypothetical protein [Asanoa hainanensis]SNS69939.1 hypothetical protein SAMN05421812_101463 [Asanoa hainanensis]
MNSSPWWNRFGIDQPEPPRGCWEDESTAKLRTTDIFCADHDRLLALNLEKPSAARWVWLTLAALAVFGAFLVAGLSDNHLPVFLVATGLGTLALGLPLRRYTSTWPAVLAYWIGGTLTMAVLAEAPTGAHQVARLVLLALTLLVSGWFLYLKAGVHDQTATTRAVVLPVTLGNAALLACAFVAVNPMTWFPEVGAATLTALVLVGLAGWLLAAVVVLIVGFVDGFPTSVRPVEPLLNRRRPPRRRRASSNIVDQISSTLDLALKFVGYVLGMSGILAVNGVWFVLVVTARRIRITVIHAALRALAAAFAAATALGVTIRAIIAPVSLLTLGGWLALVFARQTRDYLVTDAPAALGWSLATAVGANAVLFAAWALLVTGGDRDRAEPLRSAAESAKIVVSYWLLLQVVGGWLVGLPALLGYGNVRVGWFTYGCSAVLVGAFALNQIQRARAAADEHAVEPGTSH